MEEGREAQSKSELALKAPATNTIRCAKASFLLYSLSPNRRLIDHTREEMLEDLKVKLVRERLKNKNVKLCGLLEFLLLLAVLFSLFVFFLFLVFRSQSR